MPKTKSLILFFFLFAFFFLHPLRSQTWTTVCDGSGTTCGGSSTVRARGFLSTLPYDSVNSVFLYFGGTDANSGIYSNAIWTYNSVSRIFTKKVDNGATATANCPQQGAPYNTFNPTAGHPQGFFWVDGTNGYLTNQLCGGQFSGFTNRYVLSTQTMTTALSVAPYGVGDGTYNATGANYQSVAYASNVGKAYYCCYNGGATTKLIEFNGTTYTDKSSSLSGSALPNPITAFGLVYLNGYLWVGMGCNGTAPGNGVVNACNGTQLSDLYRIDPTTFVVSKMAPVGGVKPPTANSSFPFFWADTNCVCLYFYAATNDLWKYNVGTNTWTEATTTGGFDLSVSELKENGNGNTVSYDAANYRAVFVYSLSQSTTPAVYHLDFGAPAPTFSGNTFKGNSAMAGPNAIR